MSTDSFGVLEGGDHAHRRAVILSRGVARGDRRLGVDFEADCAQRGEFVGGEVGTGVFVTVDGGVAIVPAPTAALDVGGIAYRPLDPVDVGVDLMVVHSEEASPVVGRALPILQRVSAETDEIPQ